MAESRQEAVVYKIIVPKHHFAMADDDSFSDYEIELMITNHESKPNTVTLRPGGIGRGDRFNFTDSDPRLVTALAEALNEATDIIENHKF